MALLMCLSEATAWASDNQNTTKATVHKDTPYSNATETFSFLFPLDGPREYRKFASHIRTGLVKFPAPVSAEKNQSDIQNEIDRISEKIRTLRYRSPEYIVANERLILLLEQKADILESQSSSTTEEEQSDKKNSAVLQTRSRQAQIFNDLLLALPNHPNANDWKKGILVARIRMKEPNARLESAEFIQQSPLKESAHFRLLNYAAELDDKRFISSLNDLRELSGYLKSSPENTLVRYFIAERLYIAKDYKSALHEILDSFSQQKPARNTRIQSIDPVLVRFIGLRATEMDLNLGCSAIGLLPNLLVELGLSDLKMGYLERCSLANTGKNLSLTLKGYVDILARRDLDAQTRKLIEIRMLHLTLNSGETQMIVPAWQRVIKLSLQNEPQVINQINPTLRLLHNHYKLSPSTEVARHVLQMNELFLRTFPTYAERVDHQLSNLKILYDAGMHSDVVRLTELVLNKTNDRFNRATALRLNIYSRSFLTGLNPETGAISETKLNADRESVQTIVKYSDQIQNLIPKPEGVGFAHLTAQILLLSGEYDRAITKFTEAFSATTENPIVSASARFLIKSVSTKNDDIQLEKFLRIFIRRGIVPKDESRESIESLLQTIHLKNANRLLAQNKFEECGSKFADFEKEFPANTNASVALERSGFCFFKALKIEKSISQYKQFLSKFKGHALTGEIHWMLGEAFYKVKEFTAAADQYISYGRLQPEQGRVRKASLKAADSYFFAEKYREAIPQYETYLLTQTDRSERIKILTTISSTAQSANDDAAQLGALERLRQLLTASEELVNIFFTMMKIYERQKRDDLVFKTSKTMLQFKVNTATGLQQQSIAQFNIAKSELITLREINIDVRKNPKSEIESLVLKFDSLKDRLTAPCAHNTPETCVLGYHESSKLAWSIADFLDKLEFPKYFSSDLVSEIKTLCEVKSDRLKIESANLALLLEELLQKPVNLPKSELEKLKDYIKSTKSLQDNTSKTGNPEIE